MADDDEHPAKKITRRIQRTEEARSLMRKGAFDQALEILQDVRSSYEEVERQQQVDWLIGEVERRKQE